MLEDSAIKRALKLNLLLRGLEGCTVCMVGSDQAKVSAHMAPNGDRPRTRQPLQEVCPHSENAMVCAPILP